MKFQLLDTEKMPHLDKIIGLEETHGVLTGVRVAFSVWPLEVTVLVLKVTAVLVFQASLSQMLKLLTSTELKRFI
jgi:hypothetical protein